MLGKTGFIIVTVVNSFQRSDLKQTNYFDNYQTVRISAMRGIQDSLGNQQEYTDIQKQAYDPKKVKFIWQAYGLTGTNYYTHTAYINGKQVDRNDTVNKNQEILLIKNGLRILRAAVPPKSQISILPFSYKNK